MTRVLSRSVRFFAGTFGLLLSAVAASAAEESACIAWGRAQLDAALFAAGYAPGTVVVDARVAPDSPVVAPTARKAEGFSLTTGPHRIDVVGADPAGVLYGCLEAAARIQAEGAVPDGLRVNDAPVMTQRATGILLMKLGNYNFAVSPEEFPFFYDRALWLEWLDRMARMRYNSLAIWNGHPFAYFVKFDRFTEAQDGMPSGLVERNQAMLHWLEDECRRRNIRLLFQFYNIHTSVYFQRAHHLPDENRTPTPLLRDYTSYAVERFVREFPDIGLYITPGEAISLEYTDSWVNDVLYPAMQRGGLRGPVWLRAWGIDLPHAQRIAAQHPDVWFERKYNVEMIARDQADPGNRDWAALTGRHVVNVHMASDVAPFRWWPPEYIQRCMASAVSTGATALHLYPRNSWRWPRDAKPNLPDLQWERDRWWFAAWGRYAWNPNRDPAAEREFWTRQLAADFGDRTAAEQFLAAQETAADVLPSLQRLIWLGDDNHTIVSSGIRLSQLEKAEGIPSGTLPDVAQRIPAFLATLRKGRTPASPTPVEFVESRVRAAERAAELTRAAATHVTRRHAEADALARDAEATRLVAQFYAAKLQTAVLRAQAAAPDSHVAPAAFLQPLEQSVSLFRRLADLTRDTYDSISDVPAINPARLKKVPYHWSDWLPLYEREFELYQRAAGQSGAAPSTDAVHPGLVGLLYGDAGFRNPKAADPATASTLTWSADDSDRGHDWSTEWRGFLVWPRDGEITVRMVADSPSQLRFGEVAGPVAMTPANEQRITWSAKRGEAVPVSLFYDHPRTSNGNRLELSWQISGARFTPIPSDALRHSDRDALWLDQLLFLSNL
jgi:hypothetical protein